MRHSDKNCKTEKKETVQASHFGCGTLLSRRGMLAASAASILGACSGNSCRSVWKKDVPHPLASTDKPNIIVYLADAMRADALEPYNPETWFSPFLNDFAHESIVFERCFSQATWTKPSMASLFTGLVPEVHQTVLLHGPQSFDDDTRVQILRDSFTTLAEALKDAGYRTAFFQTNPQASEELGFARGFDHYCYIWGRGAEEQVRDVLDWIDSMDEGPVFVFIHQIDPHGPYTPTPEVYYSLFGKTPAAAFAALPENDHRLLHLQENVYTEGTERPDLRELTPEGRTHFQRLYWGQVKQVDDAVKLFHNSLKQRGLTDNSYFVFTSDHGESFGEFDFFLHNGIMHWPQLHVPVIVRPPGGCDGKQVPDAIGLYDLFPTLLAVGGAAIPDYVNIKPLLTPEGDLVSDLSGYTWTHHAIQYRLTPKMASQAEPGVQRVLEYQVKDIADTRGWFAGVTDGTIQIVWHPNSQLYFAAPDFTDVDFKALERLPAKYDRHISALRERMEHDLPLFAQLRERFGPPAYLENDDRTKQLEEDMRALGYM